jgi:hypothetical protein
VPLVLFVPTPSHNITSGSSKKTELHVLGHTGRSAEQAVEVGKVRTGLVGREWRSAGVLVLYVWD